MKREHFYILLVISLLITIYGVVTGKFLFLFLILPFGFGLFKKTKEKDDNFDSTKRLK